MTELLSDTHVLILPGIGDSGPEHWQSRWEAARPWYRRVVQRDWHHPSCEDWSATLEQAVSQSGFDTVLVAHSLACLVVAHWAAWSGHPVRGALLVAVPDPRRDTFPVEASGFDAVPMQTLPFPSIVVASSNDPYADISYAQECAHAWGSRFVDIGAAGHINAHSGLGDWPQGQELLASLIKKPRK